MRNSLISLSVVRGVAVFRILCIVLVTTSQEYNGAGGLVEVGKQDEQELDQLLYRDNMQQLKLFSLEKSCL